MLLSPIRGSFRAGKASWALTGCLPSEDADYCMLYEWVWGKSQVCLLSLKVHLGSVLESELRQKLHKWVMFVMDPTPVVSLDPT